MLPPAGTSSEASIDQPGWWQPDTNEHIGTLDEALLQDIASEFSAQVHCKRLAIHLGVGSGFVDRLSEIPGSNDPHSMAFQVLKRYMNRSGTGREAARCLYDTLDDATKLGMRRVAQKYKERLKVSLILTEQPTSSLSFSFPLTQLRTLQTSSR